MNTYRVAWHQCPHCNHDGRVNFVEATDVDHAKALIRDFVERTYGISWFTVLTPTLYEKPEGGRVL